jgi:hypothetical protein
MRDVVLLFVHALTIVVRLACPGGTRSILAESVFLKHQLLVLNRSRRRAPNLLAVDRLIAGLCALLVVARRLARYAIVVKPSTLLNLHRALIHRKYRLLFSPKLHTRFLRHRAPPGPELLHRLPTGRLRRDTRQILDRCIQLKASHRSKTAEFVWCKVKVFLRRGTSRSPALLVHPFRSERRTHVRTPHVFRRCSSTVTTAVLV